MADRRAVVRSYQRLFVPDRRIYAIDGRTIPVPGGVPLRWLGAFATALAVVLVVGGRSPVVILALAAVGYASAARLGRRREGVRRAVVVASGALGAGVMLGTVDWPLRLVIVPAVAASAVTQLSPDGRTVPRYLLSLARARVAGRRRLGLALPVAGRRVSWELRLVVVGDEHRPVLSRARVTGPCRLQLAEPVVIRRGLRGRRWLAPVSSEPRRLGVMVDELVLERGERVEVRP